MLVTLMRLCFSSTLRQSSCSSKTPNRSDFTDICRPGDYGNWEVGWQTRTRTLVRPMIGRSAHATRRSDRRACAGSVLGRQLVVWRQDE